MGGVTVQVREGLEQVVLTNVSDADIDVSGCTLTDEGRKHALVLPAGTVIGRGLQVTVYTAPGKPKYLDKEELERIEREPFEKTRSVLWRNKGDGMPRKKEVLNNLGDMVCLAPSGGSPGVKAVAEDGNGGEVSRGDEERQAAVMAERNRVQAERARAAKEAAEKAEKERVEAARAQEAADGAAKVHAEREREREREAAQAAERDRMEAARAKAAAEEAMRVKADKEAAVAAERERVKAARAQAEMERTAPKSSEHEVRRGDAEKPATSGAESGNSSFGVRIRVTETTTTDANKPARANADNASVKKSADVEKGTERGTPPPKDVLQESLQYTSAKPKEVRDSKQKYTSEAAEVVPAITWAHREVDHGPTRKGHIERTKMKHSKFAPSGSGAERLNAVAPVRKWGVSKRKRGVIFRQVARLLAKERGRTAWSATSYSRNFFMQRLQAAIIRVDNADFRAHRRPEMGKKIWGTRALRDFIARRSQRSSRRMLKAYSSEARIARVIMRNLPDWGKMDGPDFRGVMQAMLLQATATPEKSLASYVTKGKLELDMRRLTRVAMRLARNKTNWMPNLLESRHEHGRQMSRWENATMEKALGHKQHPRTIDEPYDAELEAKLMKTNKIVARKVTLIVDGRRGLVPLDSLPDQEKPRELPRPIVTPIEYLPEPNALDRLTEAAEKNKEALRSKPGGVKSGHRPDDWWDEPPWTYRVKNFLKAKDKKQRLREAVKRLRAKNLLLEPKVPPDEILRELGVVARDKIGVAQKGLPKGLKIPARPVDVYRPKDGAKDHRKEKIYFKPTLRPSHMGMQGAVDLLNNQGLTPMTRAARKAGVVGYLDLIPEEEKKADEETKVVEKDVSEDQKLIDRVHAEHQKNGGVDFLQMNSGTEIQARTLGRRKTSVATVYMRTVNGQPLSRKNVEKFNREVEQGHRQAASFEVNGLPLGRYFDHVLDKNEVIKPLILVGLVGAVHVEAKVRGGGTSGQAGALRLALSRAVLKLLPHTRKVLKHHPDKLLRRDARVVERKKSGLRKARRPQQWVKR